MTFSLASVFSDNMVLQQEMPVPVWGTTDAGSAVVVTFLDQSAKTFGNANGNWKVELAPLHASSQPAELIVTNPGGRTISCKNVLVGEVWLCSGQSNMEWPVSMSNDFDNEITNANFPEIRLFTVPRRLSMQPVTDIPGQKWISCSPDSIGPFSAVGYFFGRELHRRLGVPIGLINSSFGGTPAQSWVSQRGLLANEAVAHIWTDYQPDSPQAKLADKQRQKQLAAIETIIADTRNKGFERGFANLPDPKDDWQDMELPSLWQQKGLDFNGILWFRKILDLPADWEGKNLLLGIGAADKSDITYFNGEQVGSVTEQHRADSWCFERVYPVPGKCVHAGRNVIAVRVYSHRYDGGLRGPASKMNVKLDADPGSSSIPLAGLWQYAVEANFGKISYPPDPLGPDSSQTPTILFNGMIAPLVPYAIRGAVWYQGESNASHAAQYRQLFPALIRDWRHHWKRDDLPFHFVQLANYHPVLSEPAESEWAQLRDAQAAALLLPNTGMAVAIDLGEADDIHPRNKQDVGLRLALSVLHRTYGKTDVPPSGPVVHQAIQQGDTIRLHFVHIEKGLVCSQNKLTGFSTAGANRIFHWCDGKIDANTVILTPRSPRQKYVRYAWADNPVCNLYNTANLPAAPFEVEVLLKPLPDNPYPAASETA